MPSRKTGRAAFRAAVLAGGLGWTLADGASGQTPPVPSPTPGASPTTPAVPDLPAEGASIADLQEQIRQLQDLVRAGADRQQALEARLSQMEAVSAGGATDAPAGTPGTASGDDGADPEAAGGFGDLELQRGGTGGLGATDPQEAVADMPPPPRDYSPKVTIGPGFQLSDGDEEFVLQFHNLTQVDGRFYEQGGQETTRDTFGIPRQRFIFNGRVGRPFEYTASIAQGFDDLNLLDAFLNVHFDDRFQIKIGRYKTPFTYEFYSLPIQGLPTPERSIFFNNFGLNRDVGAMAWGQLFDGTIDYAAGIFNGSRNAFLDVQDDKNLAALVNVRPFKPLGIDALEFFNVGGSVNAGHQLQPRIPTDLRVEVPTVGNLAVGLPFLRFNPGVLESGTRALWSLHASWYYRQLTLIAEWQSGYENYAFASTPVDRTTNGVQSVYVWAGYFLTGETVEARGMVRPLRPFDVRKGKRGPGAVELVSRYNYMDVGDDIFTGGFSNPDLWTDQLYAIDLGVNWYWNQYVKVFAGWEHVVFDNPVLYRTSPTNEFQLTSDLFWFRFQVYF